MSAVYGDLGKLMSPIGFGAMTFGDQVDVDEAQRMVKTCLEAGVTHFDTANSYTDGEAERILGKAVRHHRSEVLLATKVGNPHGDPPRYKGLTGPAIVAALDDSLRRLGTDYIDLYYFHLPDGNVPLEESLGAANELVASGKVRALGVSNYPAWEICEQLWIADRQGFVAPTAVQMMYNLLARRIEEDYAPFAERFGLATIGYNPLAGGLLTGKHARGRQPGDGRFRNPRYRERYFKDDLFEAVERLSEVAREAGTDIRSLALRWVASRPCVSTVLVGASRHQQLEENLRSLQAPPLAGDVLERCDAVWEHLRGAAPRYDKTRMTARA
jgi:aryl-alcohol dehydrogenase-like predicted oxidoreductase